MRGAAFFLIFLVAIGLAPAARAQAGASANAAEAGSGPTGLYVAQIMETATALELAADGRFRWAFSQGALDLTAEGRWRVAEDGSVLLDTEPQVRPPSTELLGTGRERGREVIVRVADANGRTPDYLTIEAQYESGEPDYARIQGEVYRFAPERGRRIVAIRVVILWSGYVSERFELPRGDNVMRLRFAPNDLGRADFRAERLTAEGNALILNAFSQPIRYRRVSGDERTENEGVIDDIATEAGVRPPSSEFDVDDAATSEVAPPLSDEDSTSPPLLPGEGEAHLACINYDERPSRAEAIARCTALLESAGLLPETIFVARVNRGSWLNIEGEYDRAIADFDEAIRLFPDYGVAYWGRANVHERRGDFVRAAADSREAVRREPENATLLNSLCWHLALASEALDEARAACDSSLAIRPDDAPTLDSRGLVALKQGRFDEAWADYDAAVQHGGENHPTRASFLYGRGIAALRLGRTAEGQRDLADAAARDPAIAATYARHGVRP